MRNRSLRLISFILSQEEIQQWKIEEIYFPSVLALIYAAQILYEEHTLLPLSEQSVPPMLRKYLMFVDAICHLHRMHEPCFGEQSNFDLAPLLSPCLS